MRGERLTPSTARSAPPRRRPNGRSLVGRRLAAASLLLAAIVSVACTEELPPPPVLAVDDVGYTEQELGALSVRQRERLGLLTAFGLAVARGELGRVGEPFVAQERHGLLLQKLAAEVSVRAAGMDEAALRAAYAAAPEYELVVRHIIFLSERWRPEEQRREARRRAEAALERVRAGEDFATLAAELSEEPGAAHRGGLLQPGREGSWVPEFWKAASSLDVGAVSGVVETEYGFHIIKLEERRVVPFEQVRDRVLGRLVDMEQVASSAKAWAERQAAALRLDPAAIAAWRSGHAPDSVALAHWPGGAYRADAFRAYLTTLEPEARTRLSSATATAYERVVAGAARNALLLSRATALGIRLSPAEKAAAAQRWSEQAERWAAALGFQQGQTRPVLKSTALHALAAERQTARIARGEVLAMEAALRRAYPIVVASPARSAMMDSR